MGDRAAVLEKLNARGEVLGKEVHWQWFGYDGQLRSLGHRSEPPTSSSDRSTLPSLLPTSPEGELKNNVGKPLSELPSMAIEPPLMAVVGSGWSADDRVTRRKLNKRPVNWPSSIFPFTWSESAARSGAEQTRDQILEGIPDQFEAFAKNARPPFAAAYGLSDSKIET